MKYFLVVFFLLICEFIFAQTTTTCECEPTTKFENQERSSAKHETYYANYKRKKDTVDVKFIYSWEKLYADSTKNISKNPQNSKSYRKHKTPEDTLYIVKAYMWFVKKEGNDCDFHIEIGPKRSNGTRVIIEVTRENIDLQKKIKAHLNTLELKIMGCGTGDSKKAHFKKGIPIVVIGLGFYDVSHKPNTNHGDKHTKKYSWELHPVKDIIFL